MKPFYLVCIGVVIFVIVLMIGWKIFRHVMKPLFKKHK